MAYSIQFAEIVVKEQIPSIPMPYRQQIRRAIEERLTIDPIKLGKPLKYSLLGMRRLRVGNWRIIYRISGNDVEIVKIGNRKEIYEEY
ncbi:MAG: type II toxin-antitoxin system RelE/ParE family toxin [Treponema sp.]|jgi:mRNA interferase RelE/StbE|nr:type II toxin-antitoxin system RelE/ParE family toxin [Treponema sp.]